VLPECEVVNLQQVAVGQPPRAIMAARLLPSYSLVQP